MGLCLTQLCTKYRLVSTYVESLPLVVKDNHKVKASERYVESLPLVVKDNHKVKGLLYSCLLIACLPSESRTLNWHLETIHTAQVVLNVPVTHLTATP